jgi:Ca-activated chloride channel family protein
MGQRTSANRGRVIVGVAIAFAALIFCLLSVAYAQDNEESSKNGQDRKTKPALTAKPSQTSRSTGKQRGFTIGVNVDLVVNYTSVFNKEGHFVSGLKKNNFKLYEDGKSQEISYFSQEDVPVSIGFLLDISGSMRKESKREQSNKAAEAFILASNPQDEVFLIGFNEEVDLLQDYTSDIEEVKDSLENTLPTGGTALYDAIYLGVHKAQEGKKPKKAVVVITDGEDRDSYYKVDELLSKVQESDVQIFCVGILDPIEKKGFFGRLSKSAPEKAQEVLTKISEETGGKAFFPDNFADIHAIVAEIANVLRNQYSIGYTSSNSLRDGSWRRVKIEVNSPNVSNDHIRYRRGYFAPKD